MKTTKGNKRMKPETKTPAAKPEAPAKQAAPAKPAVLVVLKTDGKFRGAREAWYQRLVEHNGKPLDEFTKSVTDKPPALTKQGKPEAPGGWISWFKRQGIVEVKQPA